MRLRWKGRREEVEKSRVMMEIWIGRCDRECQSARLKRWGSRGTHLVGARHTEGEAGENEGLKGGRLD